MIYWFSILTRVVKPRGDDPCSHDAVSCRAGIKYVLNNIFLINLDGSLMQASIAHCSNNNSNYYTLKFVSIREKKKYR